MKTSKRDNWLLIAGSTLVLLSALLDPRVTIVLSLIFLLALVVFQPNQTDKHNDKQEDL